MGRIEVELPDTVDVSKWSHAEYRLPKEGESFFSDVLRCVDEAAFTFERERVLVLIPKWEYPEWLGGAGMFQTCHGKWVACTQPITLDANNCWCGGGEWHPISDNMHPLWSPPPCTDWRESWTPNPKHMEPTNGTH